MRALWKGAITFGLVNVPIKLYSATEDHDISLHQVHDADGGRIRYQRRCEVCGKVVPSEQIDEIRFDRSYFLEPEKPATKAYALLRRALEETDRTAIVQFSLRQKTRLGALRSRDKVLMLQSLLWDDEVREADFPDLEDDVKVSPQELKMASSLIDNMSADFAPDKFSDEYQDQLRKLIAAKLEQGDAVDTAATFGDEGEDQADRGEVVDLMEALRRSVEQNRAARKAAETEPSAKKSTAKKAAAKKVPAKNVGAKKAPSKQAGAKKGAAKKATTTKSAKKAS
jgi:DNA end-binding protein Ku